MRRRTALLGMGPLAAWPARAQEAWPARPVSLVVPFAPGASSDTLARLISAKAAGPLGGSFVVENRAGAGGISGGEKVGGRELPPNPTSFLGTRRLTAQVPRQMPTKGGGSGEVLLPRPS